MVPEGEPESRLGSTRTAENGRTLSSKAFSHGSKFPTAVKS